MDLDTQEDDQPFMEDLLDLVKDIGTEAMDLVTQEDYQPFMVLSDEEENHVEPHAEIDTFVPAPPSPKIKIPELSTKLNDLLVNDLYEEVGDIKKYVKDLETEVPGDLKVLPKKLEEFQSSVPTLTSKVAALENIKLDIPTGLSLDMLATAIETTSQKAGDTSVPLAGQAGTHPGEGKPEQRTNITETTTIIPLITTTTTLIIPAPLPFQSPFTSSPPNTTPQPDGEQVRDKGKTLLSHEEVVEEESKSDSDVKNSLSGSLAESLKHKPLKKFTYINENGETFQMTEEETKNQKGIKKAVKADVAKSKIKKGKQDLIDLLGLDVVEKMYKDKLELDISKPLDGQDHIIKLNFLAKKKRKNADDLHDYFKSTRRNRIILRNEFKGKKCTPIKSLIFPDSFSDGKNAIVDQIRRRNKWNNDDYVCKVFIFKMDVKTAFLNGELDEEVYINQPQGFIMSSNENKVCIPIKSLYGLKQAPKQCNFDESGKGVIIYLYVDDMLIFSTDMTKEFLSSRFSMKDIGDADVILAAGKEAEWLKNLIFVIPLWSKPIAPIHIRCDSAATLAKAYSQMYNGRSKHLGVRHSMILELITNGVIPIEFVRSQ
uniref:Zinc finger, CCHC-type n=1 Tax=Tanacetum cinerariifolium TaxID=118510 RepID=A0A6L2JV89_TANCI|nr:zinc finger, CCHC-type [Tanacetum cinerariifolium]